MTCEKIRRSTWTRGLAVLLAAAVPVVTGCDPSAEPGPEPQPPAGKAAPFQLKLTTNLQGVDYRVDLTRQQDGRVTGVRTVTGADGSIKKEPFELASADLEAVPGVSEASDKMSSKGLPGLEIKSATKTATGTSYLLASSNGDQYQVELSGDPSYPFPVLAAIILSAIGAAAIIAACGIITYWSVRSCARNNNCWSYNILPFVCWGRCQRC